MSEKTAFIVDDIDANRIFFERLLTQAGFLSKSFGNGSDVLQALSQQDTLSLAVVDMEIPGTSGLELTKRIRLLFPEACIIVATMHDEPAIMTSAFQKGCDIFIVKPHGFMELFKRLTTRGSAIREDAPLVIDQYGPRQFIFSTSQT